MLADALVSLGWLVLRPAIYYGRTYGPQLYDHARKGEWNRVLKVFKMRSDRKGYTALNADPVPSTQLSDPVQASHPKQKSSSASEEPEVDAPPEHQISRRSFLLWAVVSCMQYS